jgi:hypothetical protein
MKLVKSLGLIVLGVIIGALSMRTVSGQSQPTSPAQPRISQMAAGSSFSFVKDEKSGGCWIFYATPDSTAVTMAEAPKKACD